MNPLARYLPVLLTGCFACAAICKSATVYVQIDQSIPGEFQVLARASLGDNFGIVGYNIPLTGPITSVDHLSPSTVFATSPAGNGPVGFTFLRSADGLTTLTGGADLTPATPLIIRGFGQEGSSFVEEGFTPLAAAEQPDWGVPLLLARGTATGPVTVQESIELSLKVVTTASGAPMTAAALFVLVPEPRAVYLLILGYVALGIGGRRWLPRPSFEQ